MVISNIYLSECEKSWLEHMFKNDFLYRDEIINQINHSTIKHIRLKNLISIIFLTDRRVLPINIQNRVPIEMRVYKKSKPPMQFLLHVINGYLDELEVFYADSSYIEGEFKILDNDHIEIIFN